MSENKYYSGWIKKYIYTKIEIDGKNYYLNIEKTVSKKKENSPDYLIKIENEITGAWIKEKEGKTRIYSKIKLGNKEYHLNLFKNENKEKSNQPDYNISIKDIKNE